MQNSVAPAACERRAASSMPSTSSKAARTGVGKRADCEQKAQSSGQPPDLADTIDSTETSGAAVREPHAVGERAELGDAIRRSAP